MANAFPPDCATRFAPERLLASGGYGEVYLARQIALDRPAVVKLLRVGDDVTGDPIPRFLAEARVTAALEHPHVVRVLDHGGGSGTPWIAYEYLPGRTLRQALEAGLSTEEAAAVGAQVAAALAAAHAQGIRAGRKSSVTATSSRRTCWRPGRATGRWRTSASQSGPARAR